MREGHLAFLVEAVLLEVSDDPDSFVSMVKKLANDQVIERRGGVGGGLTSDYQP